MAHADERAGDIAAGTISGQETARTSAELSDDGKDYGWLYREGDYWYRVSERWGDGKLDENSPALGTDGEFFWDRLNIRNYPSDKKLLVNEMYYGDGTLSYQRGSHVRLESVIGAGYSKKYWDGAYTDVLWESLLQPAHYRSFADEVVFPRIACMRVGNPRDARDIRHVIFDKTLDPIWGEGYFGDEAVFRALDDELVYFSRWFEGCSNLTKIEGFEHIYTGDVLSMASMFKDCSQIEELDLTDLNTSSCRDLTDMFDGCISLLMLKLGENWTQARVDEAIAEGDAACGKATFPLDMRCERDGQVVTYREGDVIPDGPGTYTVANRTSIRPATVLVRNPQNASEPASPTVTCEYTGNEIRPAVQVSDGGKVLVEGTDYTVSYSDNIEDGTAHISIVGIGAYYGRMVRDFTIKDTGAYAFLHADGTLILKANHHAPDSKLISASIGVSRSTRFIDAKTANPGAKVPWSAYAGSVKNVIVDTSFAPFALSSLQGWFSGCTELISVKGLENLNTSRVTTAANMFSGCSKLSSISLTGFNLTNIRDMSGFFKNCAALPSMTLQGSLFSRAENLSGFFQGCTALGSMSLANAQLPNVVNMNGFFRGCSSLEGMTLANASLPHVKNMGGFFEGCSSLDGVSLSNVNLSSAEDLSGFFKGCTSLSSVSLANIDFSHAKNMKAFFQNCAALNAVSFSGLKVPNAQDMSAFFSGCRTLKTVSLAGANLPAVLDMSSFFQGCTSLDTVSLSACKAPKAQNLSGFFAGCTALKLATLMDANLPAAKNLSGFFQGCTSLDTASLAGAKITSATDLSGLFKGCTSLVSVTLAGADFAAAVNMSGMFQNCTALSTMSLDGTKMPKAQNLSNFFSGCTALSTMSLKGFGVSSATDLSGFFSGCKVLSDVDFSGSSFPKATNLNNFFKGCVALVNLDMSTMSAPAAVNVSGFLSGCTQLETVAIGGLASAGKANMSGFLADCPNLKTLRTSSAWRNAASGAFQLKFDARAFRVSPTYARCEAKSAVPNGAGEYRLTDLALQFAKVVMEKSTYTCTGKAVKPPMKVMLGDVQLQEGTDYVLVYKNNVFPGTASVTVQGRGMFSGGLIVPFKLKARVTQVGDRLVYETKNVTYTMKVTSVKKKNGKVVSVTASLVDAKVKSKSLKTMSIPDSCTVGNVKVDITEVTAKLTGQFRNVTTVYIGAKVVKIGARAFAKAKKVKKLMVKSARLKSVKNCLKDSKVKHVETRVYLSKTKRATYKTWFTKKAGKKGVKFVYGLYFKAA